MSCSATPTRVCPLGALVPSWIPRLPPLRSAQLARSQRSEICFQIHNEVLEIEQMFESESLEHSSVLGC